VVLTIYLFKEPKIHIYDYRKKDFLKFQSNDHIINSLVNRAKGEWFLISLSFLLSRFNSMTEILHITTLKKFHKIFKLVLYSGHGLQGVFSFYFPIFTSKFSKFAIDFDEIQVFSRQKLCVSQKRVFTLRCRVSKTQSLRHFPKMSYGKFGPGSFIVHLLTAYMAKFTLQPPLLRHHCINLYQMPNTLPVFVYLFVV